MRRGSMADCRKSFEKQCASNVHKTWCIEMCCPKIWWYNRRLNDSVSRCSYFPKLISVVRMLNFHVEMIAYLTRSCSECRLTEIRQKKPVLFDVVGNS